MSVISDGTFAERCVNEKIITPYSENLRRHNLFGKRIISAGQSSYGYDVTLDEDVQIFTNLLGEVVDPKNFNPDVSLTETRVHREGHGVAYVILPPNSYLLGHTVETFNIPRDMLVICMGKSTYARAGLQVNVTPIEPGFKGQVVIEISNSTTLPVRVYLYEGIAQFVFLEGDKPCEISYADRKGKYQNQKGIAHAKV